MPQAQMDWDKILRVRHRIRLGFYRDPEICSALLDRCVECIVLAAASDEQEDTATARPLAECFSTEQARSHGVPRIRSTAQYLRTPLLRQEEGESMKTRGTADGNATRTVGNDVQARNRNVIPLGGANAEKTKQDTALLKSGPALQAVVLTHDLIAERARTIWLERGCSADRDEENWREAETQLKTELGIG